MTTLLRFLFFISLPLIGNHLSGSDLLPNYDLRISEQGNVRPIFLKEAIGAALVSNLEIQIEAMTPKVMAHKTRQETGAFDPALEMTAKYETLRTPQSSQEFVSTGGTRFANGRLFGRTRIFKEDNIESRAAVVGKLPSGAEYDIGVRSDRFNNDLTNDPTVSQFRDEYRTFSGVTITQPLMKNYGRDVNFAKICVSQKDKLIADQEFRIKVATIVRNTIDAYYDSWLAYEDLKSKRTEIVVLRRLTEEKIDQLERGGATEEAVATMRSSLAEAYERFLLCRQTLLTKNGDLVMLIRQDFNFDTFPVYIPNEAPRANFTKMDPNKLMTDATKNRPEYLIALENVHRLGIVLHYRQNQLRPQLDLETTLGHTSLAGTFGNALSQSLQRQGYEYGVGVNMSIPFGNNQNKGMLAETLELKKQAVLQVKQEELKTQVLINRHLSSLDIHRKRLRASIQSTELEIANLEKLEGRLERGTATETEVLKANRDITNTKIRQYAATSDFQRSLADLKQTTGTLLSYYDIDIKCANECRPADPISEYTSTKATRATPIQAQIVSAAQPISEKKTGFFHRAFAAKKQDQREQPVSLMVEKDQADEEESKVTIAVLVAEPVPSVQVSAKPIPSKKKKGLFRKRP